MHIDKLTSKKRAHTRTSMHQHIFTPTLKLARKRKRRLIFNKHRPIHLHAHSDIYTIAKIPTHIQTRSMVRETKTRSKSVHIESQRQKMKHVRHSAETHQPRKATQPPANQPEDAQGTQPRGLSAGSSTILNICNRTSTYKNQERHAHR